MDKLTKLFLTLGVAPVAVPIIVAFLFGLLGVGIAVLLFGGYLLERIGW